MEAKTLGLLRRTLNEAERVLRGERKQEYWEDSSLSRISLPLSLPIPPPPRSLASMRLKEVDRQTGGGFLLISQICPPFIVIDLGSFSYFN